VSKRQASFGAARLMMLLSQVGRSSVLIFNHERRRLLESSWPTPDGGDWVAYSVEKLGLEVVLRV
jgi:hypothetical protein